MTTAWPAAAMAVLNRARARNSDHSPQMPIDVEGEFLEGDFIELSDRAWKGRVARVGLR